MKYQFYEVVIVISKTLDTKAIDGIRGVIVGISNDQGGNVAFSVLIMLTEEVWSILEKELKTTGQILTEQQYENRDYLALI